MAGRQADPVPEESAPVKAPLARAAASSDPRVHVLLFERDTASRAGNAEGVEAVAAQLAELGYE